MLHDFLLNPPACGQPAEREPETSRSSDLRGVSGFGFRVLGLGFRVLGLGFRGGIRFEMVLMRVCKSLLGVSGFLERLGAFTGNF